MVITKALLKTPKKTGLRLPNEFTSMEIKNIIFDFGGVLVDWNPRYLYESYFNSGEEMEYFLQNICTHNWNLEQDKGRTFEEATTILKEQFPRYKEPINLFKERWSEMLHSEALGTLDIFYELRKKYKVYGLTNWSAETIEFLYKKFPFFQDFDGIVVSGQEKMIKPNLEIYKLILDRYSLDPKMTVFIDDNEENIAAAKIMNINAIHFKGVESLRCSLTELKII